MENGQIKVDQMCKQYDFKLNELILLVKTNILIQAGCVISFSEKKWRYVSTEKYPIIGNLKSFFKSILHQLWCYD